MLSVSPGQVVLRPGGGLRLRYTLLGCAGNKLRKLARGLIRIVQLQHLRFFKTREMEENHALRQTESLCPKRRTE